MLKLPIPDIILKDIYELEPGRLNEMGITLLLMDLDNTLAKYHAASPSVSLCNWIVKLKSAGIEPFIFSNNRGNRVEIFATALSVDYVKKARKPKTKLLFDILRKKGVEPKNAAIIGDQIYTDVLCGIRAGIKAIAIRPVNMSNPIHLIRYGVEMPFRYAYVVRSNKNKKREQ